MPVFLPAFPEERRHIVRADSEQEARQHADSSPFAFPEKDHWNAGIQFLPRRRCRGSMPESKERGFPTPTLRPMA
jgi:hypothetical protein